MSSEDSKKNKFGFIPGFIRRDFLRKLIALFFAVLIWQRVDSEISETETFGSIPVHVTLPASLDRVDNQPLLVSVKLKGSRRLLSKLSGAEININARLGEPDAQHKSPMVVMHRIDSLRDVSVPRGISVMQVKPEIISVSVDKRISRTVPVKMVHSGMLMDGYSFRVASLIPSEVTITGPESIIKFINDIKTEPLAFRVENINDFEVDLALAKRDNIVASRQSVTAYIEIFKRYDLKEFVGVPVKVLGAAEAPAKVSTEPREVMVVVHGIRRSLEVMGLGDLNAHVDISGLAVPGKYALDVRCWLDSPDIKVQMIKPEQVEVNLELP
ncbi:MAG: hypothetical protein JW808_08640 [Victivallales bacterium]|nr:hypothetical protein [Victivallales bacterium]